MIEFIIITIGFIIGWYVREWWAVRQIKKFASSFEEKFNQNLSETVISAYIEKAGDTFFVYRKDDNAFLAQGTDINSLSDILESKFPGKLFNIPQDQLDMLENKK